MIKTLILLVTTINVIESSYNCAQGTGTFQNADDYRSYYSCTNYCDRLEYCSQTTEYYSTVDRTCRSTGLNWSPAHDLTGTQEIKQYAQYRHFQQSNFFVNWSSVTSAYQFYFMGRYINETYVVGTETILSFNTKCVLVRDVQLSVRTTRSFCATNVANPYSMKCKLPPGYVFSGCIRY